MKKLSASDAVTGGADLKEGYRVLSSLEHSDLHDGGQEMSNVFGVSEKQEKSDEGHTSWSDERAVTGNRAKFKNGKGY